MLIRRRKHFYTAVDLTSADPPQRNPNLREGKAAVLDAIQFLQNARSVPPLTWKLRGTISLRCRLFVGLFCGSHRMCLPLRSSFRDGIHLASQDIRKTIQHQKTTDPTSPEVRAPLPPCLTVFLVIASLHCTRRP